MTGRKTVLGRSLLSFAEEHGARSVTWFKIKPQEEVYVPTRPFRAPANATAAVWIDSAVKHFNGYSNDNSMHGRRPDSITRYVLGKVEARGVADELAKLTPSKAKAALRALADRINTPRPLGVEDPRRIWLDPDAEKVLGGVAKKLGLTVDLHGEPRAPQFNYY